MLNYSRILTGLQFKNKYNISKKILLIVLAICLIPLFTIVFSVHYAHESTPSFFRFFTSTKKDVYTNIWTIFGIAAASFTGILAFIDYYIRREVTITLFGLTLFGSVILDVYYLFILNQDAKAIAGTQDNLYFIWLINRVFYGLALLFGTRYYLKIKAKNLRSKDQKNRMILKTAVIYALACIVSLVVITNIPSFPRYRIIQGNFRLDPAPLIPLLLFTVWAFLFLPKFMLRFQSIFSKLLILSIAPLFLAQLLIAMSDHAFDAYFNAAHFLRFISYIVPLIGIIFNYVDTVINEQKVISRLDVEIREKQKVTANLLERETLLAHAEQISHLGSWELNIKTGQLKWSDELYKIYGFHHKGFEPNMAINEQIVAPEYKLKLKKELSNAIKNKGSFAVEYQIIQPNGVRKYVLGQGHFLDRDKKLLGTVQDITELKEAMLKLRQNENLLREAEAVSHNGSWEWKSDEEFLLWSDEMFNIHGYLPHSVFVDFKTYASFIHQDDLPEIKEKFCAARSLQSSFNMSYRITRPNGEIRHVLTTAKFKKNEFDDGYSYLGNTQDVTQLKDTQRKLEEKVVELNVSNKDLEQFAYVASHDLQEPLRKIQAFGERLKTKFNDSLNDEGQDYIERMRNAAERMQVLIDDLLMFSKATRAAKEFVNVELNEIIQQVLKDLDYSIESTNATIKVEVNQKADIIPQQLAQVFQNILSNSLKFTKQGVPVEIDIVAKNVLGSTLQIPAAINNQWYCVIKITDNGIGFDEEYAGKIFDLFRRLHSRSEYKGTGIGLAICKKIIENHSGFIFSKSIAEKGASFFIVLPIKQNLTQ